jgi:thioesterase domain-containing protein/acyl carrier protein
MTTTIRADAERGSDDAVAVPMLEIWRSCFEIPTIGRDDDFFALGGDSLRAILLIGMCNDRFGTTLPASALLENPTVARLTDAVAVSTRRRPASSVVTLKEGREGPALLLIHPIGGSLFCYGDLVARLPDGLAVYGLQASGLKAGEPLAQSIEEMAGHYRRDATQILGARAWHLAGWSFGGLVAVEMARQQDEGGAPVASLTLIDTPLPSAALANSEEELLAIAGAAALGIEHGTLAAPSLAAVTEAARARAQNTALPDGQLQRTIDLARNIISLRGRYRPTRLAGSATVIRAAIEAIARLEDYDWSPYLGGGCRLIDMPATHETIVVPPSVDSVAAVLADAMRTAE